MVKIQLTVKKQPPIPKPKHSWCYYKPNHEDIAVGFGGLFYSLSFDLKILKEQVFACSFAFRTNERVLLQEDASYEYIYTPLYWGLRVI